MFFSAVSLIPQKLKCIFNLVIIMSVLGIDFGSDACVIGQAGGMGAGQGRGGIDIVLNDNSKRRTPYFSIFIL